MENFLPLQVIVKKDFRGLKKNTIYDFTDTLFILDDNGKGKSTLLKGVLSANNSDSDINNQTPKDVIDLPAAGICTIGYFGQDSNLKTLGYIPDENFSLSINSLKSSSGESTFEQVLSVIIKSDIIILDEPCSSLSIRNIRRLVFLIKTISEKDNKSFIICEHNETFLNFFKKEKAYRVNGSSYLVGDYIKEQYEADI